MGTDRGFIDGKSDSSPPAFDGHHLGWHRELGAAARHRVPPHGNPRKASLLGKFLYLTAIPIGLIKELGSFGFAFRYLGESCVLGCEIQLSLYQLSYLSRGHGYSPEKCWSVVVPTET